MTGTMKKAITLADLTAKFHDGMSVMMGGFLGNGTPERIVDALVESGVKDLTLITNDTSYPEMGCGRLIANHQVKKLIVSHIGTNPLTGEQLNDGSLEIEFSPQGTLAERIRCGGSGLGGALTTTGLGTVIAEGKELVKGIYSRSPSALSLLFSKALLAMKRVTSYTKGLRKTSNLSWQWLQIPL